MNSKVESINVEIKLNWGEFPDESEMLENLIEKGNLSSFLYVILQDIKSGFYNLEESHRQQILDEIIETVTTIYSAMSGIDTNVTSLIKTVNTITENPNILVKNQINESDDNFGSFEDDTGLDVIEVESLDLGMDTDGDSDLDFTGMEDMFLP